MLIRVKRLCELVEVIIDLAQRALARVISLVMALIQLFEILQARLALRVQTVMGNHPAVKLGNKRC
jgi:hypothetical protein